MLTLTILSQAESLEVLPKTSAWVALTEVWGNIVRVIKSRRMQWPVQVARMGERGSVYRVLVG
jgi:hypothetical protein